MDINTTAFIFTGPQGSGKSTQAKVLDEYLKKEKGHSTVYFAAGSKLREIGETDSLLADLISERIDHGNLIPAFLAGSLFFNTIKDEFTGDEQVIIDGFPRTLEQAHWCESIMDFFQMAQVHVIDLEIDPDLGTKRLLERGRTDDTPEYIEHRLGWYEEKTLPVLDFFAEKQRYVVHTVDGSASVEDVHKAVINTLPKI